MNIRRADPSADRDLILAVLSRNMPEAANAERHDWLYLSNPWGRSLVWLAEDALTGETVGTSAAHPKRTRVGGQWVMALNLSDFAVDAPYRSMGPALKLLRATLEPVTNGEFAFCYDHPLIAMRALYRLLGDVAVLETNRWVRPLRASPFLERRWGKGLRSRVLGRMGDLALRARDWVALRSHRVDVELLEGDCGEEFDELQERLADRFRIQGDRSSRSVSWRFVQHTMARQQILCARCRGRLQGFAVFQIVEPGVIWWGSTPEVVSLREMRAIDDAGVRKALLGELARTARSRNASSIWTHSLAGSPADAVLSDLGFVLREPSTGCVIYARKDSPIADTLAKPENWWMLDGDRDV